MKNGANRVPAVLAVAALAGGLAACGGSDSATESAARVATTTTAAPASPTAHEVAMVSLARPPIDRLTEALRKGDATAARQALESYDSAWNGVEVYVNVRSKDPRYVKPGQEDLYATLEIDLQAKLTDGLAANPPQLATLVPVSEQVAKKYDEAIARSQAGPALSPLFDDVATIRIARAGLRASTAALAASNLAAAKSAFAEFKAAYPPAQALIKARSADAERETTAAIGAADARFQQGGSVDDVKPLVATVTDRYNYSLRLVNAAARNAEPSKAAVADDDVAKLRALGDVVAQLKASLAAWTAGDLAGAGTSFAAANASYAQAQPALAARASDTDPTRALGAYGTLVSAPGDGAKAGQANKTAIESMLVAQQVVAGQFWTDAKVQAAAVGR